MLDSLKVTSVPIILEKYTIKMIDKLSQTPTCLHVLRKTHYSKKT